jgi:hypothetical protein
LNQANTLDLPLIGDGSHTFRSAQAVSVSGRGHIALPGTTGPPSGLSVDYVPVKTDWDTEVDSLLQTCEQSGSRVLIRMAPLHRAMQQRTDFTTVRVWIGNLRARHPKLPIADPALLFYEPALCWNETHLNRAGVEKFTALVAKDVQAALDK